jgi:hypothetical protein
MRSTVDRILHATDNDIQKFLGFFTETTVFRMGNGELVVGRDAITQWTAGYLSSVTGTTHDVKQIWQDDAAFAVQMDVTYQMKSGQSITLPAVTEMRLDGELLTHYLIYIDASPVEAAS